MKYKVRITKQPRYQDGGAPALGDFSNLTEDQLENGPVYGFRSEPETQSAGDNQRVSMQELPVSAGRIPSYSPNIVPVAMDMKQVSTKPQYKGVSIVDYLNLLGLPTSRSFRTNLAKEYGIKNYTGTALQNKQLISILDNLKDNFIDFGENKPVVKNNVVRHVGANNNNTQTTDIATDRLRYFTNQKEMADIADERLNYYRPRLNYYRPNPQIPIGFEYMQGAPQKFIKQEGGAQDAQQQIIQIVKAYAQKSGADPKSILLQLQKMQPEEQQQALQQMAQSVQSGGDEEQATMKRGGRVSHQSQSGGAQQQIMQIIQAFAQMQGVDPKEVMQQLQQMKPQEQQQALQQMVQAIQQGQQQAQQQGPQEEQMEGVQGHNPQEEQLEPQMAYGGQMGYGLDLGARRLWMNQDDDKGSEVTDSIEEVPREQANIEAEGGETALIPYKGDGTYLHKKIKGNRHTEGGVPLNVPEGTFIYSDTKKMKLGGPVLQMFGKSEKSTKKFTPAILAKQYNIDKYRAILNNPKSDPIVMRTAQLMIQNYEKKLAQLALVQESKKGFPQGIPEVARDYYQQMQQAEQAKQTSAPQNQIQQPQEAQEQQQGQDVDQDMEQGEQPQAMYGMGFRYGGGLYEAQAGVQYPPEEAATDYTIGIGKGGNKGLFPDSKISLPEYTFPNDIGKPFNYYETMYQSQKALDRINNIGKESSLISDLDGAPNGSAIMLANYKKYNPELLKLNYTYNTNGEKEKVKTNTAYDNNFSNEWSTPDKLGMLNSLINLASVKKATPFEPAVKLDRAETYYTDPSRALAANAEQSNAARQSAAMFAGPQSRYSFNNGQYGANAANIIGQYATQNVGFGNQAAQQNAAINNQQMQYDTQRAKRLYDAGVIGEQQYQNAIREARAAALKSYAQGYKNSSTLYNLNKTTANDYIINQRTGLLNWNPSGGKDRFMARKANASGYYSPSELNQMAKDNNMTSNEILNWYRITAGMRNQKNTSKSNQSSNSYGYDDDSDD
jgi:hypothetical protein